MTMMKAAVIPEAGGPEVLKIESLPIPTPQKGEVLIRVKAFGLNRSELFTRQGHSPNVRFTRPRHRGRRCCRGSSGSRVFLGADFVARKVEQAECYQRLGECAVFSE